MDGAEERNIWGRRRNIQQTRHFERLTGHGWTYWGDVLLLSEIMFYREAICEERPVIDGLMCTQEYGNNNTDMKCLWKDVSHLCNWRGSVNTSRSDSAYRIRPVGPTWTGPSLFHKIKNGRWMICWPPCPQDVIWWLFFEFKNQLKPVIQQTCVSSFRIQFWFQVSFLIPITQWNNPVIPIFHCPNYNLLTSICPQKRDRILCSDHMSQF